jgi:hypothetical protein
MITCCQEIPFYCNNYSTNLGSPWNLGWGISITFCMTLILAVCFNHLTRQLYEITIDGSDELDDRRGRFRFRSHKRSQVLDFQLFSKKSQPLTYLFYQCASDVLTSAFACLKRSKQVRTPKMEDSGSMRRSSR